MKILKKKLPFSVEIFVAGLILMSYSVYSLPHWNVVPIEHFISFRGILLNILMMLISIILIILSFFIPSILNKWIADETPSRHKKTREKNKTLVSKILYIINIISNLYLIVRWLQDDLYVYYDTFFLDDIMLACAILSGCIILKISYELIDKTLYPVFLRIVFIFLRFITLIQWILVYAAIAVLWLFMGGIFQGDLLFLQDMQNVHNFLRLTLSCSFIILTWIHLSPKFSPLWVNPTDMIHSPQEKNGKEDEIAYRTPIIKIVSERKNNILLRTIDTLIHTFLIILYIAVFFISLLLLTGDYLLVFNFFTLSIGIGLIPPISILLDKFAKRTSLKVKVRSVQISKIIAAIMIVITLIPLFSTILYTNPDMDKQFSHVFGDDWQSRFGSEELEKMRSVKYSFSQNFAGFDVPNNAEFNQSYLTDFPTYIKDNDTVIMHTFYFDAYLPQEVKFGEGGEELPVIIMMHGEVEDKGPWNANWTSQYLANLGFLVIDLNYGYVTENHHGNNYKGYLIRDVIEQIGKFTYYLSAHSSYYHADLSKTYFSGRHLGGSYALIAALGHNSTLQSIFTPEMSVLGVIAYYPIVDFGAEDTSFHSIYEQKDDHPLLLEEDFMQLSPIHMLQQEINSNIFKPPILIFEGTHDFLIPVMTIREFKRIAQNHNFDIIVGEYLWGGDGFDGLHFSPWGQSCIYYFERFLFLSHKT